MCRENVEKVKIVRYLASLSVGLYLEGKRPAHFDACGGPLIGGHVGG